MIPVSARVWFRRVDMPAPLISTYKRLGIDPFACWRDVFVGMRAYPKNRREDLLLDNWAAVRTSAAS